MRATVAALLGLALVGCVGDDTAPPITCDPLSIDIDPAATLVTVTFRNCGEEPEIVSGQWCNAPWTSMTVRVVHLPAGRSPVGWGVLDGGGPSRATLDRFAKRCPETFEEVEPSGEISTDIPWNGTFFEDRCAREDGGPSNFTCPTWRPLDPGLYDLEARVWPFEGEPWEERLRVRRPGTGPSQ